MGKEWLSIFKSRIILLVRDPGLFPLVRRKWLLEFHSYFTVQAALEILAYALLCAAFNFHVCVERDGGEGDFPSCSASREALRNISDISNFSFHGFLVNLLTDLGVQISEFSKAEFPKMWMGGIPKDLFHSFLSHGQPRMPCQDTMSWPHTKLVH